MNALILTLAILSGIAAHAQGLKSVYSSEIDYDGGTISSQGFRISVLRPVLEAEIKSGSSSDKMTVGETLGIAVGYASLPVQDLGFTANLALMEIRGTSGSAALARLDGNLAYALNPLINFKGGINVSRFSRSALTKLSPGLGAQGGVGFQFNPNFGLDLGYTQMNQTYSEKGSGANVKESGFEIGLNATF